MADLSIKQNQYVYRVRTQVQNLISSAVALKGLVDEWKAMGYDPTTGANPMTDTIFSNDPNLIAIDATIFTTAIDTLENVLYPAAGQDMSPPLYAILP